MPIIMAGHFYVFGWDQWEERGGLNDLISSHTTFEDAKTSVDLAPKPFNRYQVAFFAHDGSVKVAATKRNKEWSVD